MKINEEKISPFASKIFFLKILKKKNSKEKEWEKSTFSFQKLKKSDFKINSTKGEKKDSSAKKNQVLWHFMSLSHIILKKKKAFSLSVNN